MFSSIMFTHGPGTGKGTPSLFQCTLPSLSVLCLWASRHCRPLVSAPCFPLGALLGALGPPEWARWVPLGASGLLWDQWDRDQPCLAKEESTGSTAICAFTVRSPPQQAVSIDAMGGVLHDELERELKQAAEGPYGKVGYLQA